MNLSMFHASPDNDLYRQRIHEELHRLGISLDVIAHKGLPFYAEAQELVIGDTDSRGREYKMTPETARAWAAMKKQAALDGIVLEVVSSFRTIEKQIDIIEDKLRRNMPMDKILTLSAPPGYSEHHTGRALDINTPGCVATEPEFEFTDAYRWLEQHAGDFGFTLSYPKDNSLGFIHEPWHWLFASR